MKSKVLLINPPFTTSGNSIDSSLYIPIGLLYVAAAIRDICQVKILDCCLDTSDTGEAISRENQHIQLIRNEVADFAPDIIGITILAMPRYKDALITASICKDIKKDSIIVFGGPDPSVRFETILGEKKCDYCIVGEGEFTMKELILAVEHNSSTLRIPGLAQIHNDSLHFRARDLIEDLDCLPFPAYDLIDLNQYLQNNKLYTNRSIIPHNSVSVITSRGCPFSCSFCSIALHMGEKYRSHSAEYVYKHLDTLSRTYNVKNIHFEDDNISFDKKRFISILEAIINNGLSINWDTPNGIRADTLDDFILQKMKESGCKQITLAIESGSQRVIDDIIRKKTNLSYILGISKSAKKAGLNPKAFYVIGFPGESIKDIRTTLNLAIKLFRNPGVIPVMAVAIPLVGTALYQECLEKKYIDKNKTLQLFLSNEVLDKEPIIQTEDFSHHDIQKLMESYYKKFKRTMVLYGLKNPLYTFKVLLKRIQGSTNFREL